MRTSYSSKSSCTKNACQVQRKRGEHLRFCFSADSLMQSWNSRRVGTAGKVHDKYTGAFRASLLRERSLCRYWRRSFCQEIMLCIPEISVYSSHLHVVVIRHSR